MAESIITTIKRFIGLSTDTKPSGASVPTGSTFLEYDTQTMFITPDDGMTWVIKSLPANNAVAVTTIELKQDAGDYDLFTVTGQDCLVDSLGIVVPVDMSAEASFTGISIQSTDDTPVVFLSDTDGAVAELDKEGKHFIFRGPDLVAKTKKIQLTIYDAKPGTSCECTVFVSYRPVVAGGYLAT